MKLPYALSLISLTVLFVGAGCPVPDQTTITSIEPENSNSTNVDLYVDYSPAALAKAQANGIAVLYFYAPWCSTCKSLNQDLLDNTTDLPPGVTVLKVDYDTAEDLKDQYDVVQQHTLIQLDSNGNEVTRWIGGDVETIIDSVIYP